MSLLGTGDIAVCFLASFQRQLNSWAIATTEEMDEGVSQSPEVSNFAQFISHSRCVPHHCDMLQIQTQRDARGTPKNRTTGGFTNDLRLYDRSYIHVHIRTHSRTLRETDRRIALLHVPIPFLTR